MESLNSSMESNEGFEHLKKKEDDHLRLQRQFRQIQVDRQHRTMGVHPQFRRQDNLLKTLKMEYEDMTMNLKIARSGAHKKHDRKMKKDLMNSIQKMAEIEIDCEGGAAITEELEGLVQRYTVEMIRLKQGVVAFEGQLVERQAQGKARLASAENKLETVKLRFNTVQGENRKIREEIEHMLKDRVIFNQSWEKMISSLCKGKKFLTDLFESSNLAYDQRDEWVAKLRSVQEKGKVDQMTQIQEMRDLKKCYDHEMKMYRFLARKGVVRINQDQERREEEEKRRLEEEERKEYERHEKILNDILDFTGFNNHDLVIEEFQRREQQNFSIYKLMADCCAENEVRSRELRAARQLVEDRREWNEAQQFRRTEKMETLKKQLEEQQQKNAELRALLEEKEKKLTGAMDKVLDMYNTIGGSLEPFQNLLGDKKPSLHRLNFSMCLLTDKIQELIETVYYSERVLKIKDKSSTSRLKKYTTRLAERTMFEPYRFEFMDPCPSCIESRWLSRESETAELPLSPAQALCALRELAAAPAYVRSDRVHALADCRAAASRRLLAQRHNI